MLNSCHYFCAPLWDVQEQTTKHITSFPSHITQKPLWISGNSCQPQLKNDSLPVGNGILLNWAYEAEIYGNQPWLPLWWQMSQLDLPQTILDWLFGTLDVPAVIFKHIFCCFCFFFLFAYDLPLCFSCDLRQLVLSSVPLILDFQNWGHSYFLLEKSLGFWHLGGCLSAFGSIDPLPHGPESSSVVPLLTPNQKNPPLFPFLLKYFGEFLASIFISLKGMHVSQLLSAGVCVHLFVYFLKCNWEYAWKHKSVFLVHSKQI